MKRWTLFIFGILLSAALGLQLGRTVFALPNKTDLLEAIFKASEVDMKSLSDAHELETLAQNAQAPFSNLYLYMLQNVTQGPEEAAVQELAKRLKPQLKRAYSTADLKAIFWEGSVSPITARFTAISQTANDPKTQTQTAQDQAEADASFQDFLKANSFDSTLTDFYTWTYQNYVRPDVLTTSDVNSRLLSEQVLDEYIYLTQLYQRELQLQRDTRKLGYQALASEMFINGNLADSANVDLLADLDTAHTLFFGSKIKYPDRSNSNLVSLASLDEPEPLIDLASTASPLPDCAPDDALRSALELYEASPSNSAPSSAETPGSGIQYPALEPTSTEGTPSNGSNDATGFHSSTREQTQAALKDLGTLVETLGAPEADWTRTLPCNDVFCLTIGFTPETAGAPVTDQGETVSYQETDNCIACHLSFLNAHLNETVSSPLAPGKISMNYFEDSTCKEGGTHVDLGFHVRAIPRAIDLDPFDNLDEAPTQDTQNFLSNLRSTGALPSSSTGAPESVASQECRAILNANVLGGSPQSIDEIQAKCDQASSQLSASVLKTIQDFQLQASVDNIVGPYEQISAELASMLLSLNNLQGALQETYAASEAPLPALLAKPYCE